MDTPLVISLILLLVVGFFAYQWWAKAGRRLTGWTRRIQTAAAAAPAVPQVATPPAEPGPAQEAPAPTAAPMRPEAPETKGYPAVSGQTEGELRAPEPLQRRAGGGPPQGVGHESYGPVPTPENLRHPEQLFRAPAQAPAPTMNVSEVQSGRAAVSSTPLTGHQQPFSPEMAQNGGAIIGNTMFAFDGMEPTGFASF